MRRQRKWCKVREKGGEKTERCDGNEERATTVLEESEEGLGMDRGVNSNTVWENVAMRDEK